MSSESIVNNRSFSSTAMAVEHYPDFIKSAAFLITEINKSNAGNF